MCNARYICKLSKGLGRRFMTSVCTWDLVIHADVLIDLGALTKAV